MENEEKRSETTTKIDSQAKGSENPPKVEVPEKKSGFNMKIILFGLPLFILQLVVVYFVTANILLPKINNFNSSVATDTTSENKTGPINDTTHQQQDAIGKYIYSIEDIIVNPAGTNGQKLLLSSLAFDLPKESFQKELQGKEILVKDKIISILSSKTIDQLSNSAYKDSLRAEISNGVSSLFPEIKINKVYFSKYIIN